MARFCRLTAVLPLCAFAALAAASLHASQEATSVLAERAAAFAREADEGSVLQFKARYTTRLDDPPLETLEIVTPFRRAVQAVWDRNRGQDPVSVARQAIGPSPTRISIVVHLGFPPQNLLVRMPAYTLVVHQRAGGPALEGEDVRRVPRSRLGDPVPAGTMFLRGTVEAAFERSSLDLSGPVLVGVLLDGREVRRIPVDFRAFQ
jgi:hypothetical protein